MLVSLSTRISARETVVSVELPVTPEADLHRLEDRWLLDAL